MRTLVLLSLAALPCLCLDLSAGEPTAKELRLAAHQSRDVWENFPGFTAAITVSVDGASHTGVIRVNKDFKYTLDLPEKAVQPWVHAKLRSVISHRQPSPAPEEEVEFVDEASGHIAGRLIAHTDGSGTFRVNKDGILIEVHRKSDNAWFEITNIEQFKTHTGRYLPRTTTVTYRDPKTGDIESNRSNLFTWKRVGDFYLPEEALTFEGGAGGKRTVHSITFANHKLASN